MKILVPLPEPEARRAMFEELLPSSGDSELPYDVLVDRTEGYSGSDIRLVCKEAAMQPLRRLMTHLEQQEDSFGEGMMLLNQSNVLVTAAFLSNTLKSCEFLNFSRTKLD